MGGAKLFISVERVLAGGQLQASTRVYSEYEQSKAYVDGEGLSARALCPVACVRESLVRCLGL